jgi:hypothetical protein
MRTLPVALAAAALTAAISGLLPSGKADANPVLSTDTIAQLRSENQQLRDDLSAYMNAYDELHSGMLDVERAAGRIRGRNGQRVADLADNALSRGESYVSSYDSSGGSYGDGYNQYYGYQVPDRDFTTMSERVSAATYADDQLSLVQDLAQSNYFTTAQVVALMKDCNYEDTRVDIAAALYPRIVDPQNWYLVNDGFTYSSSKKALRERLAQ